MSLRQISSPLLVLIEYRASASQDTMIFTQIEVALQSICSANQTMLCTLQMYCLKSRKNNALNLALVHCLLNDRICWGKRKLTIRMTMNLSIYRPLGDFPDSHHPKDTTQNEKTQLKLKVQTAPFHESLRSLFSHSFLTRFEHMNILHYSPHLVEYEPTKYCSK